LISETANYKRTVFPNGLKVVTEAIPYVRSVSLGLWVDVGSRDENERNSGVSHFIEHMVFKGTSNRDASQIASYLESVGGVLNAFTSREQTCFYAKFLDQHIEKAVEVIFDLVFNALFDKPEIEKEKRVILEEIKDVEDAPSDLVHDKFAAAIFGDHPLGRSILGSKSSVKSLNRKTVLSYLDRFYVPGGMLVAASGNLDHAHLVNLIGSHLVSGDHEKEAAPREKPEFSARKRIISRKSSQTHICLGVPAIEFTDPGRSGAFILNAVLGGGMSSRLFQKLRDDLGIVYNIFTYLDFFQDTSVLGVYLAADKRQARKAVSAVMKEIDRLRKEPLTDDDLCRAKEQLKGNLMLGLENTSNRMNRLAKHELLAGRYISLDETVAAIDAVKSDEITDLANGILDARNFSAVALGAGDGEVFSALQ
jgi:predicted Zn-dependent peptidase